MLYKKIPLFFLFFLFAVCILAQMPEYYSDKLNGKKNKELKTTLYLLLKDHTRIPYGSSYGATWTVFRKSDVRPDGSIWDMYSNTRRSFPSGTTGSNRDMNIEHSAPKSWWGEGSDSREFQYDASFDLHHLVPSDAKANMAKSNYILGEVETATFDNGVSKVGTAYVGNQAVSAFEPADEYKGDFARMYFYVVTCYQNYSWVSSGAKMFQSNEYPTLTDYGKELLLKWHRQDPVSQKEIDRNNAVYSFQHTRNPYIDYPDLVEYIWGKNIGVEYYMENIPHILEYKSGDFIEFPDTKKGITLYKTIHLQGKDIKSKVSLSISGDNFVVKPTEVTADQLNKGIDIELIYIPLGFGWQSEDLLISGGGLADNIVIHLKGLSVPEQVARIFPVDLKASYRLNDGSVPLQLNIDGASAWSGNGVALVNGGYVFNPEVAGVGTHYLSWNCNGVSGKVKVIVK